MERTPTPPRITQERIDLMRLKHTGPHERVWGPGDTYHVCGCGEQVFEGKLENCRNLQMLNSYEYTLNAHDDLLEALEGLINPAQQVVEYYDGDDDMGDLRNGIQLARAAIAKAKGTG